MSSVPKTHMEKEQGDVLYLHVQVTVACAHPTPANTESAERKKQTEKKVIEGK